MYHILTMNTPIVHARLPTGLTEKLDEDVAEGKYDSRTDAIRTILCRHYHLNGGRKP